MEKVNLLLNIQLAKNVLKKLKRNKMYATTEKIKDNLYVQKTKFGDYRVVYPIVKDIEQPFSFNNIHWKNFLIGGRWSNVLTLIFIVGLIMFSAWAYKTDMKSCEDHLLNPCHYCARVDSTGIHTYDAIPVINISSLENTFKKGDADEGTIP
jgi:hypothetical protein